MRTAVVTADEMKRLEKLAFEAGESEQEYMENAGKGIAKEFEKELLSPDASVFLLVGKGNNGGDAFVVGEILQKKGYSVTAYCLFPKEECSPLSQNMRTRFEKAGGTCKLVDKTPPFSQGVILDGLVGTGFKGSAEGLLAEIIEGANASGLPLFAIDIPSGLDGTTGEVGSCAIKATKTYFLGLPKIGFYLKKGWNYVGELVPVDFGMPSKYSEKAREIAQLFTTEEAKLPPMEKTRHKYEAGYVLALAGSKEMPGAAMMSCFATLKAGAGIVRLFFPKGMEEELTSSPLELIKEGWDLKDDTRIFEEEKRAKALIVGPGSGRSKETEAAFTHILAKTTLPTVMDADALYFLSKNPRMKLPEKTILTPHQGEMERILGAPPTIEACQEFVREKKVTLVLKGAPTFVFHPQTTPQIVPYGDPGMATAGTGDVLTGILAALLAQKMSPFDAACLGVLLHALAGELAAKEETSYGVVATDLIHFLPDVFHQIQ